jgi:hypothetical protein
MKLEGVIHCEGPDCIAHQHVGVPNMDAGRLPAGWLRVVEYGDTGPSDEGFCGWDCVLKRAALFGPPTIIRPEEPER